MILIQFLIPPYASKGYAWPEMGTVIGEILGHAIVYNYPSLYPVFKLIPIILVIALILFGNRATEAFTIYVAITYILFAFLQNIAVTDKYGLGIVTVNLIMFLFVAAVWLWEAIAKKNDFSPQKRPWWKYWVVPLALLAFWFPLGADMMPDFNPLYLVTNAAGLTFCMMTSVYLAILTLYYPRVNMATLRVTSIVGVIIGFYNMMNNFLVTPAKFWWNGVLHIPLVIISVYALVLSLKRASEPV